MIGNCIRLYSINKHGLLDIYKLLRELNINAYLRSGYGEKRNVYALIINKKENLQRFSKKIGFSLTRKNQKLKDICSTIRP